MTDDMHEDPADVLADMILTAEKETREPDPNDLAERAAQDAANDEFIDEFIGAYGRVYTRTDVTTLGGEPIWEDEDGDSGTMDDLEYDLYRAEAMGDDAPF